MIYSLPAQLPTKRLKMTNLGLKQFTSSHQSSSRTINENFSLILRKAVPFQKKNRFICMFCGGKSCRHENWLNNKNAVIKGLDSDWITDDILAMQRPSSRLIKEFDIVQQFKE